MKPLNILLLTASLAFGTAAYAQPPVPTYPAKTATITGVFGQGYDDTGVFFGGTGHTLQGESFVLRFNYALEPGTDRIFQDGVVNDPRLISHSLTVNGVTFTLTDTSLRTNYRLLTNGADGHLQNAAQYGNYSAPNSSRHDWYFDPLISCPGVCYGGNLTTNADYSSRLLSQTTVTIGTYAYGASGETLLAFNGSANNGGSFGVISSFIISDYSGAVPEPASWMMLIAGFGIVGATRRRRRSARVIAA